MHIISGNLGMESARRYESSGYYKAAFGQTDLKEGSEESSVSDKGASKGQIINLQERAESMRGRGSYFERGSIDSVEDMRRQMAKYIYLLLFGKEKSEQYSAGLMSNIHANANEYVLVPVERVVYSSEKFHHEEETTSFSAKGVVKTADGRELSIDIGVTMSRSLTEYTKEELKISSYEKVYDPLVINFSGSSAELTEQRFFFDIDMDGREDSLARLGSGSGYLALDKNGDGIINDGSELFGPQSGDGFGELSAYDEDRNGWIDEGDSVWEHLRIWCQNPDGSSTLYRLSDKKVGAVCLQNTKTQFSLKDAKNCELGYLRASGVFLFEDGRAGTVQHLDLVR